MNITKYKNEIKIILMNAGATNLTKLVRLLDSKLKKDSINFDREIFSKAIIELQKEQFIFRDDFNLYHFIPREIK